jgi:hypothetical protein
MKIFQVGLALVCLISPAFSQSAEQAIKLLDLSLKCTPPAQTTETADGNGPVTKRILIANSFTGDSQRFVVTGYDEVRVHRRGEYVEGNSTYLLNSVDLEGYKFTLVANFSDFSSVSSSNISVTMTCSSSKSCFQQTFTRDTAVGSVPNCGISAPPGCGEEYRPVKKQYKTITLSFCDSEMAENAKIAIKSLISGLNSSAQPPVATLPKTEHLGASLPVTSAIHPKPGASSGERPDPTKPSDLFEMDMK